MASEGTLSRRMRTHGGRWRASTRTCSRPPIRPLHLHARAVHVEALQEDGMFENMIEKLKKLAVAPPPFDPSRFGDPLASQTAWTPIKAGGSNFRTYKLVKSGPNRVEFRPMLGAVLFYLMFAIIGLAMVIGACSILFSPAKFEPRTVMLLFVGLLFTGIGGYLINANTQPVVFEKGRGAFWKGRKGPDEVINAKGSGRFARLDDVHALQVISEYCSGGKSRYYSYELNLVLKNGERINVVDHGNRTRLREDAEHLAAFLGKPLWDATTGA